MRFKALLAALAFSLIAQVSPLFADTMIPLFDGHLRLGDGDRAAAIFDKDRNKFYLLPRDADAFSKASLDDDLVYVRVAGSGSYGFAKDFQEIEDENIPEHARTRSFCTFDFDVWLSSIKHEVRDEGYVDPCIILTVTVSRTAIEPEDGSYLRVQSERAKRLLAGQLVEPPDGYPRRMSREEAVAAQYWEGAGPLLPGIPFFSETKKGYARFDLLFPFDGHVLGDGVLTLNCSVGYDKTVEGPCYFGTQRYPTQAYVQSYFNGCACEPKDRILQQLDAALAKTFADFLK